MTTIMAPLPNRLSAVYWAKRKQQEREAENALLRSMTDEELWSGVEDMIAERSSVYAREWSYDYRKSFNAEITRYRHELNRRGQPGRKPHWLIDAQVEAEDVADLRDTQDCVRGG